MSALKLARLALASSTLFVLVVLGGCYETEQEVGPRDHAKVDIRLVGDWDFVDKDSGTTRLVVRNFNDREYYLTWGETTADPHRAAAFVAQAGGASFAHVRELKPDGVVP
jgi:hypothetical protein